LLTAGSGARRGGSDVELKIGIVQRFGEEPTDHLNLQATPGDRLTLNFKQATLNANGKTPQRGVKLEVVMQPLPTPAVKEQVVSAPTGALKLLKTPSSGVRTG